MNRLKPWLRTQWAAFQHWRDWKVPVRFGRWQMWAKGDVVLQRVYWHALGRKWWTPFVKPEQRYKPPPPKAADALYWPLNRD